MKRLIVLINIMLIVESIIAQTNTAELLSKKIAQRMKDSLQLSNSQQQHIYTINMQIHQLKAGVWAQYSNTDSITRGIQGIEGKRDSLYRAVLTEMQFSQYRLKKRYIVNSN